MKQPSLDEDQLAQTFDPATLKRAQGVYKQGKVLNVKQSPTPNFDKKSRLFQYEATVVGSKGERYDTRVTIIESDRQGHPLIIIGNCDCPVGDNCKHAAAVCLQLMQTPEQPLVTKNSTTASSPASMRDLEFRRLIKELEQKVEMDDDPDEWVHFHLFNDYDQAWSDERLPTSDLKITRHHYTARGNLAKPKAMAIYTYTDKFSFSGSKEDLAISRLLRSVSDTNWHIQHIKFMNPNGHALLKALVETGRCYFQMQETPLSWQSQSYSLTFEHNETQGLHQLSVPLTAQQFLVLCDPPILIDTRQHTAQPVTAPLDSPALTKLMQLPPLSQTQYNDLVDTFYKLQAKSKPNKRYSELPKPVGIAIKKITCAPTPLLVMSEPLPWPYFELSFIYDDYLLPHYPHIEVIKERVNNIQLEAHRDLAAELEAITQLHPYLDEIEPDALMRPQPWVGLLKDGPTDQSIGLENYLNFQSILPKLAQQGWQLEGFEQAWLDVVKADEMRIESEVKNDWFNLSFNIQVKGKTLPMAPILDSLLRSYDNTEQMPESLLFQLNDKDVLQIPKADVAPLFEALLQLYQQKPLGKGLAIQPFDAHLIAGLANTPIKWLGDNKLMQLAEKLKNFTQIETITPPPGLNATLRPYQAFGLSWLQFLYDHGFNGVLADDMGLGKTLQTLSWLLYLKQQGELNEPALLVVPTSLIGNWRSEAQKFTPDLKLLTLHGNERAEQFAHIAQADLVLTTYPLLPRDIEQLKEHTFKLLILDEAQKIKNPRTKLYGALMELKSASRVCLTGTPVENHLGELWSLFNFLMPGFLGNQMQFKKQYQKPIEVDNDRFVQAQLTRKVAPFLLRRTKHQVVQELPDKTEIIKTVEFEPPQAKLYETIRITMEEKVRQTVAQKGLAKSQITLLDALLKLRQVCCDPGLVKIEAAKKVKQSAKLALLMELLDDLLEGQHKVIIFSQFSSMLKIIADSLTKQNISYSLLTGQTKNREDEINRFKNGETQVFLISLKAGGVGLNLTEADTVIHYDPWWNPAVENQATDRAYRIGQDKEVFVYKLVVANSIEEKILQLQAKKQQLQDKLYDKDKTDEQGTMNLVAEDLLELLKPQQ
ncbi:DEAD/DEAH box helicase [Thiomicrospira sp. R3]|uniref:DEAD/DEAH box helicase n=1 Tax=Thiomicrospira sp. R3 TaxID=3035472 RepID=UPI00259B661F|nr:DEAD/DEAH box helicase [Thiomicrospira sp. R3]WFE69243.1 DEAD/DEAH box helicase [Thiomicrospira sp. R3]